MKNILPFFTSMLIAISIGTSLSAADVQWGYVNNTSSDTSGNKNRDRKKEPVPENWSSLSPEFTLCDSGKNQSPVDIDSKKTADGVTTGLKFNYGLIKPGIISNTGKAIQIDIGEGTNIQLGGNEFALKRMDFHIPSEHTFNGEHYPMEIQLLHESKQGDLANVSLMVIPGRPDRTLRKILQQLPMKAGQSTQLASNAMRNMEIKQKRSDYYSYSGSITTPPCTEGVHWLIMKQPWTISKAQYQQFKTAIGRDNNRSVQKLNARIVAE